jgi:hypothetical protein
MMKLFPINKVRLTKNQGTKIVNWLITLGRLEYFKTVFVSSFSIVAIIST